MSEEWIDVSVVSGDYDEELDARSNRRRHRRRNFGLGAPVAPWVNGPPPVRGAPALTEEERAILDHLADAWNLYCALRTRAASDDEEMQRAIHAAQALIALRVARRANPEVWRQP